MVASDSFAEFLREQLVPLGSVTTRRMFGKTGVFCDGLMFAMVTNDTLYFRVDDHNRTAFKEAEAFPPLSYEKKGGSIDMSFWRAPERLFDEPDELVTWARAAIEAAHRVAAQRERQAPRRKSKPLADSRPAKKGRAAVPPTRASSTERLGQTTATAQKLRSGRLR